MQTADTRPFFFLPRAPHASLHAKKEGLGARLVYCGRVEREVGEHQGFRWGIEGVEFSCCSYWSRIDVALRAAAYSGVTVRLMGSYWNHTSEDMLHFLKSLSDDTHTGHNGIIETVSLTLTQTTMES